MSTSACEVSYHTVVIAATGLGGPLGSAAPQNYRGRVAPRNPAVPRWRTERRDNFGAAGTPASGWNSGFFN